MTMTAAQEVSSLLHDDGQVFDADDGTSMEGLCMNRGADRTENNRGAVRFVFPDGSVITCYSDGWNYGYRDCWCWQGGHADDCTAGGGVSDLRETRVQAGVTQSALARGLGVSSNTVARWERGEMRPNRHSLSAAFELLTSAKNQKRIT